MCDSKLKKGDFIIALKDLEDFHKGKVYEILNYLPLNPWVEHSWTVNSEKYKKYSTPIYNEEYLLENFDCVKIQRIDKLLKLESISGSKFEVGDCITALNDIILTNDDGSGFLCHKGESLYIIYKFDYSTYEKWYIDIQMPTSKFFSLMFSYSIESNRLKENFTTIKIQRKEKLKKLSNLNE